MSKVEKQPECRAGILSTLGSLGEALRMLQTPKAGVKRGEWIWIGESAKTILAGIEAEAVALRLRKRI